MLDDVDDREDSHVGNDVDKHVVGQRGDAKLGVAHDGQHDVAGLRDGAEGHEALELGLPDGKEVGNGDAEHDDDVEHVIPILYHGLEHFHKDGAQCDGSSTLGDNTQITGNRGWSTLIGVGRPEMEGYERNLEGQAAEEEHEAHNAQRREGDAQGRDALEGGGYIAEVEGAGSRIDERDAEEHDAAGERGHKDVLGGSLGGLLAMAVEGDHTGQGHGGHLKAEEEHEEVAAGHHDEHAQQGADDEQVVLALELEGRTLEPRLRHDEHHEGTEGQDDLHNVDGLGGHIEAGEGLGGLGEQGYAKGQHGHEGNGDGREHFVLLRALMHEEVDGKHCYQDEHEAVLGHHI